MKYREQAGSAARGAINFLKSSCVLPLQRSTAPRHTQARCRKRPERCEEGTADTEKIRVEELKIQLKTAVENEEYEKAALLRDEIKGLEGDK